MNNELVVRTNESGIAIRGERWQTVLTAFLQTLDSDATKRSYRKAIEHALPELGELDRLTATRLTAYREQWVNRLSEKSPNPLSPSSVALHLAALRSFLSFARLTGQTPLTKEIINFALKSPKATVITPYRVPTEKETTRMIVAARSNIRDRMILTLADRTGLREAELANLRVGDLSTDDDGDLMLRVRMGKGRKDRIVPLDKDTAALVRSYLAARGLGEDSEKEYLFASRKGKGHGKLSTARIRQLKEKYRKAGRVGKKISMHSFRHGSALRWLRNDGNIVAVQKLLGHSSLATTQKYLDHLELDELKRVVNAKKEKK